MAKESKTIAEYASAKGYAGERTTFWKKYIKGNVQIWVGKNVVEIFRIFRLNPICVAYKTPISEFRRPNQGQAVTEIMSLVMPWEARGNKKPI